MKTIEYFYSAHSAYAYIGHLRLLEICSSHGCELVHKPIDLRPVVRAVGSLPFDRRTQHNVDYHFGREIERWAQFRNIAILSHRPTYHDRQLDFSNGILIAGINGSADIDALSYAILQAHWRDDADLEDPDQMRKVATNLNPEYGKFVDIALSEEVQRIHSSNTNEAIERGIFGSPTYFLDGDMYYGQDHLELMEYAISQPFGPFNFLNPKPGDPRLEK
ncbi:2-hydroxychromene-2-carboxylate isomerase [Aliishimia ponticola]|uniref:2-hydroxychromene-2-carboxylate isomerase n=1 Tax=Aliishimia ponticola TaxID=2499833 RepID=A0A4S4N5J6_9RHOB|nr:DsbA family protein [Aliishimia ponticola]THH34359.1 2-hydroxychromene-2-carboxylate isomerase [Aliishimia ponticola]